VKLPTCNTASQALQDRAAALAKAGKGKGKGKESKEGEVNEHFTAFR